MADQFITRVSATVDGMTVRGYAAVYGQPTLKQRDYPGSETIARGAFDGLLGSDVLALRDHQPTQILGRTSSGTLRLGSDEHGLSFELDLPDTQLGRDTATLVSRGDLNGMSFGAVPGGVVRTSGGVTHTSFKKLVDVSIVSLPAYDGTSVQMRNAQEHQLRARLAAIRARVLFGKVAQ